MIALGAYVRLKDAGLGCPDWPGCYGHLIGVPDAPQRTGQGRRALSESPVIVAKAWTEMAHRYLAGTLDLLITDRFFLTWRQRAKISGHASSLSPALATVLIATVAFQALLGMWTVTLLLKPAVVAHLLGGMTTLALLLWLLHSSGDARHTRESRYPSLENRNRNQSQTLFENQWRHHFAYTPPSRYS